MVKTITATEANRSFSTVFRAVAAGEVHTITSHGHPTVMMVPVIHANDLADRVKANERLMARLRSQKAIDIGPWTRDELYED